MIARCYRHTDPSYARYGGRGIRVCERWRRFANFLADMGERPTDKTLDRINNDGNYEPGNCRWATLAVQNRNRRDNVFYVHGGFRLTMAEWSRKLGIPKTTLYARLRVGHPLARVLRRRAASEDSASKETP